MGEFYWNILGNRIDMTDSKRLKWSTNHQYGSLFQRNDKNEYTSHVSCDFQLLLYTGDIKSWQLNYNGTIIKLSQRHKDES